MQISQLTIADMTAYGLVINMKCFRQSRKVTTEPIQQKYKLHNPNIA